MGYRFNPITGKLDLVGDSSSGGATDLDSLSDVTISSPTDGQALAYNATSELWENKTISGSGDMLASTYDPNSIAADAFDQDNMVDGTTNKNYTATEKTKLAGIASGAEVNVNADWNSSSGDSQILNKPTIPTTFDDLTDGTTNKAFTATLKTKLNGIASGAEVNTVDSVNTQTGAVVLDADDIDDTSTTNKFVTASDLTNLSNLSGTNTGDQDLSSYVTLTGTETLTNKDLSSATNTFPTFNQDTTGNAATATKLETARTIAGVSFDGSANISIGIDGLSDVDTSTNAPTDGQVLAWNNTDSKWEPADAATGGSGISSVVEDTTPQLGGDLDLNSHKVGDATATDLTKLNAITASATELNTLDGITASVTELNILDGATLSTTELNYVDGVTSAIQTQLDGKVDLSGDTMTGQLIISGSDASNFSGLRLENNDGTAFSLTSLDFQNSGETALSRIAHMIYSGGTSADLRFYLTNAGTTSAAITFEHHGRLGVGVTSPSVPLHVLDAQITEHISQDLFSDGIRMYKKGNGTSSTGAVKDGSEIGYHSFYGYDGSAYGRGAFALVKAVGDFSTTSHGMSYEVYTTPSGSTTAASRLKIGDDGAANFDVSLSVADDPVVTETGTQTLTNKTLTSPVINSPSGFLTGAAKITVSDTEPSSPSTGDIWIDTT